MKADFDIEYNRKGTYCTQWDYVEDRFGEKDLLPFSISDTDFKAPEPVLEALKKRMENGIFGYTRWCHDDFKGAISRWYRKSFQYEIDTEQIVYSPSVIYTIAKIMELVTEPGDCVVTQTPAYDAFYKVICDNHRLLSENKLQLVNGRFEIDFVDLEYRLKQPKTKMLLLCSPHNPTGRVWSMEELKKITALCRENQVFLISDEIHMDVVRGGIAHHPILKASGGYEKICLCTSASKTFNIPGLIGSYAMIRDKSLREEYLVTLKNRDGLSSTSTLGMEATMAAYRQCDEWVGELNEYLDQNMEYISRYCQKYLPDIRFTVPEATYLAWLDCSAYPFTMDQIQDVLVHRYKVAIMRGAVYGEDYDGYLRLNAGCPLAKLKRGLEGLRNTIDDLLYVNS